MDLSGLHIDELHPFMGASPDGLISCKCCGEGLLEIKCSYMFQNKTPHEACTDHHYHVYLDQNNSVRLKESSSWYTQIQGQMGVCKNHGAILFCIQKRVLMLTEYILITNCMKK